MWLKTTVPGRINLDHVTHLGVSGVGTSWSITALVATGDAPTGGPNPYTVAGTYSSQDAALAAIEELLANGA